jgi:hypothetical protein
MSWWAAQTHRGRRHRHAWGRSQAEVCGVSLHDGWCMVARCTAAARGDQARRWNAWVVLSTQASLADVPSGKEVPVNLQDVRGSESHVPSGLQHSGSCTAYGAHVVRNEAVGSYCSRLSQPQQKQELDACSGQQGTALTIPGLPTQHSAQQNGPCIHDPPPSRPHWWLMTGRFCGCACAHTMRPLPVSGSCAPVQGTHWTCRHPCHPLLSAPEVCAVPPDVVLGLVCCQRHVEPLRPDEISAGAVRIA